MPCQALLLWGCHISHPCSWCPCGFIPGSDLLSVLSPAQLLLCPRTPRYAQHRIPACARTLHLSLLNSSFFASSLFQLCQALGCHHCCRTLHLSLLNSTLCQLSVLPVLVCEELSLLAHPPHQCGATSKPGDSALTPLIQIICGDVEKCGCHHCLLGVPHL